MHKQDPSDEAAKNKMLRQKRTMRYFLDAASEIIAEEGVEAITIRKVSSKAGYSSGSIYKYFENINHLLAFAAIDSINSFVEDLSQSIDHNADPLEMYFLSWHWLLVHSMRAPALYSAVFLQYGTDVRAYLDEYYEVFPEARKTVPKSVQDSFFAPDVKTRDYELLQQCVQLQYLQEQDIGEISDLFNAAFLGFLNRGENFPDRYTPDLFLAFMRRLFLSYNPALAEKIDAIQENLKQHRQ